MCVLNGEQKKIAGNPVLESGARMKPLERDRADCCEVIRNRTRKIVLVTFRIHHFVARSDSILAALFAAKPGPTFLAICSVTSNCRFEEHDLDSVPP
jgi:hypothetical protein